MNKFDNKKNIYITIIILTLVLIGIGYALITNNISITGNTNVKKNTWDVHFENIKVLTGSVSSTSINITNDTSVNYNVSLKKPGDYFEFTVDVVNKGSFDAMINGFSTSGLSAEQQKYIKYSASYDSGVELEKKQLLKKETGKDKLRVRVEYRNDINDSDLPTTTSGLNLTFTVEYGEAENAVSVTHPICKRATILHTEKCNQIIDEYNSVLGCREKYNYGDTLTYGSLGTSGTLSSGDAFDCDVDGDGSYNVETERFYYLTNVDTNSNYGLLLYYSNVSGGVQNSTTNFAYLASGDVSENGPKTAIEQLPTTAQWKNVSLSNTTRKLTDQDGTEYCDISYEGKAARLPTVQEIAAALNTEISSSYYINQHDNSLYMMEKTYYTNSSYVSGYWFENYRSNYYFTSAYFMKCSGHSCVVFGLAPMIGSTTWVGVRPVIEVEKSKISY